MAEDQDDNVLVGIDQNGNLAKIRTKWIPGPAAHYQAYLLADPTTGDLLRPASQADVAALGTALAAILAELGGKIEPGDLAALATAARQDAAKGVLDAILSALAPAATAAYQATGNASLSSIDGKLPAQVASADGQATATAILAALQTLAQAIKDQGESTCDLLNQIANGLPRLNRSKQLDITTENDPNTTYSVRPLSAVSLPSGGGPLSSGQTIALANVPVDWSNAAAQDLYSRIQVQ